MGNLLAAFKGLVTAPGYLVRDEASCTVADNVSFRYPGRIRPRGGFGAFEDDSANWPVKLLASPATPGLLIANTAQPGDWTGAGAAVEYMLEGVTPWLTLGTIDGSAVSNPVDSRMALSAGGGGLLYLTSSVLGVRRFGAGLLRFAGMPRGLAPDVRDMNAAVYSVLSAGTLLPDGWARAYRVTWHRRDNNRVLLGGAPTARVTIRNVSGTSGYASTTSNVSLRLPLPWELGTLDTELDNEYFYRLWGTRTWDTAAAFGDDECFLIAEEYIDATDITNGFATVTDATPDAYLQGSPPLHTNAVVYPPSDEGIRQGIVNADDPPPIAGDVAYHADVMWYANTQHRPRQNVTLLAVGGPGFVDGDSVTVTGESGSITLDGVAAAPTAPNEFTVVTGLTTTEENIEATARNLVACMQRNSLAWGGNAYHVSVSTSEPGLFFLEACTGAGFVTFSTSAPQAFRVEPTESTLRTNRLFFSKPDRADAVPPVNFLDVGPDAGTVILRISPFRDRLMVWTSAGLYQVTGNTFADFAVSAFDLTTKLVARESVAAVDDRLYALTLSGVVEVSEGGVTVVSLPIDDTLHAMLDDPAQLARMKNVAFGLADQLNHEYRLFLRTVTGTVDIGLGCDKWLTFDTRSRAWSWGFFNYTTGGVYDVRSCGVVTPTGQMRLGGGDPTETAPQGRYFYPWPIYADVAYDDTAISIATRLRFTFQAPNPQGLLHWQQTLVKYETLPLAPATVTFYPDENYPTGSAVVIANTVSRLEERVEVPWGARRSTRMAVEYQPTMPVPGAATAPIDLAGIEVSYSSPTRYGRKSP